MSFIVSFLFGGLLYFIFAQLNIFNVDLDDINKDPVAIGAFLLCYQIFLGLIVFASLNVPLG
jgi:succinate-acetate transporter protein